MLNSRAVLSAIYPLIVLKAYALSDGQQVVCFPPDSPKVLMKLQLAPRIRECTRRPRAWSDQAEQWKRRNLLLQADVGGRPMIFR
jgi:hypothetical protein